MLKQTLGPLPEGGGLLFLNDRLASANPFSPDKLMCFDASFIKCGKYVTFIGYSVTPDVGEV